ncbi:hypothetical protein FJZ40_05005 [Candidatus Shapirobacteria bacterium]|nr:hypothetical protein [Candidatus Shapirobacteria bacterium]
MSNGEGLAERLRYAIQLRPKESAACHHLIEETREKYPSLASLVRASFHPWLLQLGPSEPLLPDHLQSTLVISPELDGLPSTLYHVSTDWVLHCTAPDKPEILLPSGVLEGRNFSLRSLATAHIYDFFRLSFVAQAVWGGAEIDLNDFERASANVYTPDRAYHLLALFDQFKRITCQEARANTGTTAPTDELKMTLTEIGIRPDSPWGKIILAPGSRGAGLRQEWFPTRFYFELHLDKMRGRYKRLGDDDRHRLAEAKPLVFAYQRPEPPLAFIYPLLFLRQYGKLTGGADRDPRRLLPAPKGVTKEQLIAILCREADVKEIAELAREKGVGVEIVAMEQYRKDHPKNFIDFCEVRYQGEAEQPPFTHKTIQEWMKAGLCVPLVEGRKDMPAGVYTLREFFAFKEELRRNPFSFLGY